MILLVLLSLLNSANPTYVISVYADVYKDAEFFTRTYPWIVDNIGGDIVVDYYLLGTGRYSVPQMCALSEMKMNTYLQAQYLKCEAEGNPSEMCLCETGIDPKRFRQCVSNKGSLASYAAGKYTQLGIDVSPVIEIGPRNTVFRVEDSWYLKKICTIFGDDLPRGCVKPFACNATEDFSGKKALAQFDKDCGRNDCECFSTDGFQYTTTNTPQYQYTSVNYV